MFLPFYCLGYRVRDMTDFRFTKGLSEKATRTFRLGLAGAAESMGREQLVIAVGANRFCNSTLQM